MTDEDDRMDRAKRIREMREGNRAGDERADGNGQDSTDSETSTEDKKQTMDDLVEAANENTKTDEPTDSAGENESDETGETDPDSDPTDTTDGDGAETAAADAAGDLGEETGDVSAPLPDSDTLEAAIDDEVAEAGTEAAPAGTAEVVDADETETTEEETRVLEFTLDDEHYCLDISYIEEIVKQETITRVPNTPEYVEGVVDLRGQITTILNPKVTLGKENTEASELVVVFDSEAFEDQGHIGWVVDDVRQVSPIVESEVNDPPMEAEYINGVIDRDEEEDFVIWTSPELALEEAD